MTTALKLPKEELSALRPEDVQLYLGSRGWRKDTAASTPKATVYRFPDEPDSEVVLPSTRDLGDYALRMGDVAEMLAAVEQRSIREVLVDLSGPPADIVRLGILASEASLGTLPLEEGIRLVQGGRDMLLAAACSAHHAQPFYPRQSFKEATDFLSTCRLGQTERGSFVATIIAPVAPLIEQRSLFDDGHPTNIATEPYARRVTWRLMTALHVIQDSIRTGTHNGILQGIEDGVSANLCDAIESVKPPGDQSSLQIRISWARSRPNVPPAIPQKIVFSQAAFPIIEEASRQLRERGTPSLNRVEGYVVSLRGETTLLEGFEGNVVIKAMIGGQSSRVQMVLNKADYAKACDAHRDARAISVSGVLHRGPKAFELLQPQNFQIKEESP
jgi:hypothetical protein